jgi:hypothetical protein
MQAEYYSDKSIAVFGDTKPWAEDLRVLGGKFNYNLKGRPGWIFQKAKENELVQLITNANSGSIQPQVHAQTSNLTQMVPLGATQPAMTPQVAMARLSLSQTPPPQQLKLIPQPKLIGSTSSTVNYPNRFEAADGIAYQIVMYTIPLPRVGQRINLTVGELISEYYVTDIKNVSPVDDITISSNSFPEVIYRVVIVNGKWKILGMNEEHTVTFIKD